MFILKLSGIKDSFNTYKFSNIAIATLNFSILLPIELFLVIKGDNNNFSYIYAFPNYNKSNREKKQCVNVQN